MEGADKQAVPHVCSSWRIPWEGLLSFEPLEAMRTDHSLSGKRESLEAQNNYNLIQSSQVSELKVPNVLTVGWTTPNLKRVGH